MDILLVIRLWSLMEGQEREEKLRVTCTYHLSGPVLDSRAET